MNPEPCNKQIQNIMSGEIMLNEESIQLCGNDLDFFVIHSYVKIDFLSHFYNIPKNEIWVKINIRYILSYDLGIN